jgi:hypothetical protein
MERFVKLESACCFSTYGAISMAEWDFAQTNPAQELAELRFFSIKKRQGDQTIEFRTTVREYAPRNGIVNLSCVLRD